MDGDGGLFKQVCLSGWQSDGTAVFAVVRGIRRNVLSAAMVPGDNFPVSDEVRNAVAEHVARAHNCALEIHSSHGPVSILRSNALRQWSDEKMEREARWFAQHSEIGLDDGTGGAREERDMLRQALHEIGCALDHCDYAGAMETVNAARAWKETEGLDTTPQGRGLEVDGGAE